MNRRVWVWVGSILGCALVWNGAGGGAATLALAQPAPTPAPPAVVPPAPPVPPAATLSPTLLADPNAQATGATAIPAFIKAELAQLQLPVPGAQRTARATLVAQCPKSATTSYRSFYAATLAAQVKPLLAAVTTPLQTRISLGVVIGLVAGNSQGTQLEPAIEQLLADPHPAVALLGMKAAKPVVMTLITQPGGPGQTKLFGAVVASVKQHKDDFAGFIANDAYQALVVNVNNVPNMPAKVVQPLLPPLYGPVLNLLALRTAGYAGGLIPAPEAERAVTTFLSAGYASMTPAQQVQSVQALVNFIDAAGQRAALCPDRPTLTTLTDTIRRAAGACNVMSAAVTPGSAPLANIAHLPLGATADAVLAATQTAYPSMSLTFPSLRKPPTLPPIAPPTAPAAAGGSSAPSATAAGAGTTPTP